MLLDGKAGHAGCGQPLAQPFAIIGQHLVGGIALEKRTVMARAAQLVAIRQEQRAVEGVRMRPRQHGERGEPVRVEVGERPGDAAAPIVAS